jgi:hypothetical protein
MSESTCAKLGAENPTNIAHKARVPRSVFFMTILLGFVVEGRSRQSTASRAIPYGFTKITKAKDKVVSRVKPCAADRVSRSKSYCRLSQKGKRTGLAASTITMRAP